MNVRLSDIRNWQARREHGSIAGLKTSIADIGLINPLTIDEEHNLLAGRRRYQALVELGFIDAECYILPMCGDQLKTFAVAIEENVRRKNMTEVEEAIARNEYEKLRRKLHGDAEKYSHPKAMSNLNIGWSQQQTAIELNVSRATISRSKKIATAIEKYPQLAEHTSGQAVLREFKRLELQQPILPTGKYHTIIVDPPWNMDKIIRNVTPNQYDFDYPIMSLDEIKNLPMLELAMDDCHLYLWTTQRFLPYAFDILKAWGFQYIFTMVWHKRGGFQPFNLPQYNCEFILFGKKGDLPFLETKNFFSCFSGMRREHSRKPIEFYDIVKRVSPEPRLDYFSREMIDGFDQYGDETNKWREKSNADIPGEF